MILCSSVYDVRKDLFPSCEQRDGGCAESARVFAAGTIIILPFTVCSAGYAVFVDECLGHNNRFEAKKYIVRLPADQRLGYYIKIT